MAPQYHGVVCRGELLCVHSGVYNSECNSIQAQIKKFGSKWHNQFIHLLCCCFPLSVMSEVLFIHYSLAPFVSISFHRHLLLLLLLLVAVNSSNLSQAFCILINSSYLYKKNQIKSNSIHCISFHLIWFDLISYTFFSAPVAIGKTHSRVQ